MIREEGNRSAGGRSQPAQGRPDPFHDLRVQRRPSGRAPPQRHSELRSMGSGYTSRERVRPGGTGIVRLHVADLRRSTGHRSGSLSSPVAPEASCWQRALSRARSADLPAHASSTATARSRSECMVEFSASARPPDYRRCHALRYRKAQLRDSGRDTASGSRPPGCVPCRPPLRLRRRGDGQGTDRTCPSPSPAGCSHCRCLRLLSRRASRGNAGGAR